MKKVLEFILATLLMLSSPVWSLTASDSKGEKFDFKYSIYGHGRSKPTLVFDDGGKTYLQYPAGAIPPVFISINGLDRYQYDIEGPYLVINGVPRELIAQLGHSKTHIIHNSLTSTAVQYGHSHKTISAPTTHEKNHLTPSVSDASKIPNSWLDNSYAKPIRGDVIQWVMDAWEKETVAHIYFDYGSTRLTSASLTSISKIANQINNTSEVIVLGTDDDSYTEGIALGRGIALKNALIQNGIDASHISVKSAPSNEAVQIKKGKQTQIASLIKWRQMPVALTAGAMDPARRLMGRISEVANPSSQISNHENTNHLETAKHLKFNILLSDRTLVETISRWGRSAGWTVVNQGAPEIKITGEMEFHQPDFIKAADIAIAQSRDAGYRIEAFAYRNKFLVIGSK